LIYTDLLTGLVFGGEKAPQVLQMGLLFCEFFKKIKKPSTFTVYISPYIKEQAHHFWKKYLINGSPTGGRAL